MTSSRFAVGIFALITATTLAFFSCGSDDKGDDDTGGSTDGGTSTPTALSSQFASACATAGCHGADGTGGNGYDLQEYASNNSASAFLNVARNGTGSMAGVAAANYSNTSAANDHAWLKAQ